MKKVFILILAALMSLTTATGRCENARPDFSTLEQAAKQGDAAAQCNLGMMYLRGEQVAQN